MSMVTTKVGVQLYVKDWGQGGCDLKWCVLQLGLG